MSHTPGPWTVWVNQNTTSIESVHERIADDVANVNAALIAAAPDLLSALREVLAWAHDMNGCINEFATVLERARAVIAKAEGRE